MRIRIQSNDFAETLETPLILTHRADAQTVLGNTAVEQDETEAFLARMLADWIEENPEGAEQSYPDWPESVPNLIEYLRAGRCGGSERVAERMHRFPGAWCQPYYGYVHTGATVSLSRFESHCDSGCVGWAILPPHGDDDQFRVSATAVNAFAAWRESIEGNVFEFTLEDEDGEIIDSLGNVYGMDAVIREVSAASVPRNIALVAFERLGEWIEFEEDEA